MKNEKVIVVKAVRYGYVAGKKSLDKYLKWNGGEDGFLELRGMVWADKGKEGERGSLRNTRRVKVTIQYVR